MVSTRLRATKLGHQVREGPGWMECSASKLGQEASEAGNCGHLKDDKVAVHLQVRLVLVERSLQERSLGISSKLKGDCGELGVTCKLHIRKLPCVQGDE